MTEANHSEPQPTRRLFDVKAVARVLGISWRTGLRLADAGKVPPGCKLGALRRWDATELDDFIAGGCVMSKVTKPKGGR